MPRHTQCFDIRKLMLSLVAKAHSSSLILPLMQSLLQVLAVELPHEGQEAPRVWDLDTLLPFPCELAAYSEYALQIGYVAPGPEHQRYNNVYLLQGFRG